MSGLVATAEKAGSGLAAEAMVEQRRRAMKNKALVTLAISVYIVLKKGGYSKLVIRHKEDGVR